jgi:hypothetical protein
MFHDVLPFIKGIIEFRSFHTMPFLHPVLVAPRLS